MLFGDVGDMVGYDRCDHLPHSVEQRDGSVCLWRVVSRFAGLSEDHHYEFFPRFIHHAPLEHSFVYGQHSVDDQVSIFGEHNIGDTIGAWCLVWFKLLELRVDLVQSYRTLAFALVRVSIILYIAVYRGFVWEEDFGQDMPFVAI